MNAVSLFSGIGGFDLSAMRAGIDVVLANEMDPHACGTYRHNFPGHRLLEGDVRKLSGGDIPDHDILMAGFPCQAFSIAGRRMGFDDDRGLLFFEIMRLVDIARPRWLLLENVANLESHDRGRTWRRMRAEILGRGYSVRHGILNLSDFGVPQNRERIFVVCRLGDMSSFDFPWPRPDRKRPDIDKFVDFDGKKDGSYYLSGNSRYLPLFDGVRRGEVWQLRRYYARRSMSGLCPTLTANMGLGGHNVPFVRDAGGIRKLTEDECLALQGLDGISFPDGMARCHRYRQIGNSVPPPVVSRVLGRILHADAGHGVRHGEGEKVRLGDNELQVDSGPNWNPEVWGS